ncbi:MAG: zinc ribbon domain-containing protein [Erysipelotrichaceae bacterium]|nr:zinc ribbon domain-containing protein [Erysipelotrichaceae bacterium]
MGRVNFYTILKDLSLDEKNKNVIEDAINKWYKDINQKFTTETDSIKKKKYEEERNLKDEMISVMLDPKARNAEAKAMAEIRKKEIENLAVILSDGQTGPIPISNVRLKSIAEKTGLKLGDVNKIFKDHKFEVSKPATQDFNKHFLSNPIVTEINSYLNEINRIARTEATKSVKSYDWLDKDVHDLYELMACYDGHGNMNYRSKSTDDLFAIADKGNSIYTMSNSDNLRPAKMLFSKAKVDVFGSDDSRRKYNNSLLLTELDSFFAIANNVPNSMKKDETFAEAVIKKIQTKFPDYDLALTIYNYKLGLARDPYEPEKVLIHVYCGNCQTATSFTSSSEAMKAKCPTCGEPFYKKCPNCGKIIPSSSLKCPQCHLDLKEYQYFDTYYNQAMLAIKNLDIGEATTYINKARTANPKSTKLQQLENELKAVQKQYEKPLNQLQSYMNNHEYLKARNYINQLKTQFPKLNLASQEKVITNAISNAQKMFSQKGNNTYEAANNCVKILREVKDFVDAKEYLNKVTPRPAGQINRTINKNGVLLSWNASVDLGVTYVVVRNTQHIPAHMNDGTVIFESETEFQYLDKTVESGLTYNYALFVKREGTVSTPVCTSVTLHSEIDTSTFSYFLDSGKVTFNWNLPKNALGIRILRCKGGSVETNITQRSICLATKAYSNFTDNQIENGVLYQYRFQVVYQANGKEVYTMGIVQEIINEDIPLPTTLTGASYNENTKRITLKIKSSAPKPYKVQVINLEQPFGESNDIINTSDIGKYGKVVAMGDSMNNQLQLSAFKNVGYQFGIVTIAGSKAILGNTIHVSTFDRCDIDKSTTKLVNGRLHIHLVEPLATNIQNLYYACKVKTMANSKPPYLTKDDLDEMRKIPASQYNKQHSIMIDAVPEKELYITVIAEVNENGKVFYTTPAKLFFNNRPKTKLEYSISWKGTFKKKRNGAALIVEVTNNKLEDLDEWPNLYLVARTDGRIPKKVNANGAVILAKLDENSSSDPNVRITDGELLSITFDVPNNIPSKAPIRMFLNEDDMEEYELDIIYENSLVTP